MRARACRKSLLEGGYNTGILAGCVALHLESAAAGRDQRPL